MVNGETLARVFGRCSSRKLVGILHKAENDIYERLGELSMDDDVHKATQLAEDVDRLILAINLHLGFSQGRSSSSSLRGISLTNNDATTPNFISPLIVSELLSILSALYSVLIDVTISVR